METKSFIHVVGDKMPVSKLEDVSRDGIKFLYPEAYFKNGFSKVFHNAYSILNGFDKGYVNIRPDCFFHFWKPLENDGEEGVDYFIACEIEDTNPLTVEKLKTYGDLWDCACAECLELWTFNRYGQFQTSINLQYWFWMSIGRPFEGMTPILPNRKVVFPELKEGMRPANKERHDRLDFLYKQAMKRAEEDDLK